MESISSFQVDKTGKAISNHGSGHLTDRNHTNCLSSWRKPPWANPTEEEPWLKL